MEKVKVAEYADESMHCGDARSVFGSLVFQLWIKNISERMVRVKKTEKEEEDQEKEVEENFFFGVFPKENSCKIPHSSLHVYA